jgi:predicted phosphodiesterase
MPDYSREDGLLLVNPGSPTQRRRAEQRSFAIMTIDASSKLAVEFVSVT